jgi:hypothetical protein
MFRQAALILVPGELSYPHNTTTQQNTALQNQLDIMSVPEGSFLFPPAFYVAARFSLAHRVCEALSQLLSLTQGNGSKLFPPDDFGCKKKSCADYLHKYPSRKGG